MPGGAKTKTRTFRSESPPPIDNVRITVNKGGIDTQVPAIHRGWMEPRDYVAFSWPPAEPEQQQAWLAGIRLLMADLRWLLRRPYHRFWSQVVHDLSLAACVDSSLQLLPRPHELHLLPPAVSVREAVQTTAALLLRVTLRMATYKESKEHHMTPALFASLVYDNYVWDMPRLLDVCAVYAAAHTPLLQRQLTTLFTHQPAYTQDLQLTALSTPELLERLEERVCGSQRLGSGQLSWPQLWDLLLYLVDLTTALDAFLMVYPDGSRCFVEAKLPVRLAAFYDSVIPRLWRRIEAAADSEAEFPSADVVRRHLHLARFSLLSVFRRMVEHCCLRPLREADQAGTDRGRQEACGDLYMEVMTECLGEQHLLADYNQQFGLAEDATTVRAGCPDLDPARLEYVLDAVLGAAPPPPDSPPPPPLENGQLPTAAAAPAAAPSVAGPSDVEVDSLVSHVRDLLPDLSHSFVTACLRHYGFSAELVINALLEHSLPPLLAALDRTVEMAPPSPPPLADPPQPVVSQLLSSRRNVFDGDQYDVMSRDDADVTAYHRGKRMTASRLSRELADKSHLRAAGVRERYQLFGSLTTDGSVYDAAAGGDDYEDEYDDTYDDGAAAQGEPEEEERGVPLSAALPSSRWRRPEPAEEEPPESGPPPDRFVQNPEEVRARQEARRQQQRGGRRGRGGRQPPPPDRDVVGAPKGQGQSKQVVQNRRRKAEHKSTQARRGADRKARAGMF